MIPSSNTIEEKPLKKFQKESIRKVIFGPRALMGSLEISNSIIDKEKSKSSMTLSSDNIANKKESQLNKQV